MHLLRLAFLSLLPFCVSARAELEFAGVLANPGEIKVVFRDQAAGFNSGWVNVGATVRGYTVLEYQAARDTLIVQQGEKLHELPLARPKIQGRMPEIVGNIKITGTTKADLRCDLVFGVPRVVPLPDGRRLTVEARKEPDGTVTYHAGLEEKTGKVVIGGQEIPVVGKRQVNGTAPAGQYTIVQVGADVTVSLQF